MKTFLKVLAILAVLAAAGYWAYDQLEKNYLIGGSKEERAQRELEERKYAFERIYSEKFSPAIDPVSNVEKHKNIYDRISQMVKFPILYPETLPEDYKLDEVYAIAPSPDVPVGSIDKGAMWTSYTNGEVSFKLTEGGAGTKSLGTGNRIKFKEGAMMMSWILKSKSGETNIVRFGGTPEYEYTLSSLKLGEKELVEIGAEILNINDRIWEYQELWFRPSTVVEPGDSKESLSE